jgi:hypothetical protein
VLDPRIKCALTQNKDTDDVWTTLHQLYPEQGKPLIRVETNSKKISIRQQMLLDAKACNTTTTAISEIDRYLDTPAVNYEGDDDDDSV